MAKYRPSVGDVISFNHSSAKSKSSLNTGTITWVASSGKFLTVYPHSVIINNAYGKPIECALTVDSTDIIGLSK